MNPVSVRDPDAVERPSSRRRRAALLGQAARGGERAPSEPATEGALQRARAAHGQLSHSHRTTELRSSQVDAIESGSVDADLEVDIEPWMLQAHGDLRGLEHHPVALGGIAKVELEHGSAGGKLLTMHMAGHP